MQGNLLGTSLFQGLGQWGRSKKWAGDERGLGLKRTDRKFPETGYFGTNFEKLSWPLLRTETAESWIEIFEELVGFKYSSDLLNCHNTRFHINFPSNLPVNFKRYR